MMYNQRAGGLNKGEEKAIQHMNAISVGVDNRLCVRKRFVHSECAHCVENCPRNAIVKERGGIRITEACDGCGACIPSCPNGALFYRDGVNPIEKISSFKKKDRIIFICKKSNIRDNSSDGIVNVNCLGALSVPELILSAKLAGEIVLAPSDCKNCESKKGMKNFGKFVKTAKEILSITNFNSDVKVISSDRLKLNVNTEEKEVVNIERRRFLSIFKPQINFKNKPEEGNERENRYRKLLFETLLPHRELLKGPLPETIPCAEITVNREKCFGCNVCEYVCPGRAITRTEDSDKVTIMFNPTWCTACNACVSACLTKAISLKKGVNFDIFLDNKNITLIELKRKICRGCNIEFFSDTDTLCPRCGKKIQEARL